MAVKRFDVFWVILDPTVGHEIKKKRPCVVISPDEMNDAIGTVIIAPMTTGKRKSYPTRIACFFNGRSGQIVLDQIRTVDKTRLLKPSLGTINPSEKKEVLEALSEMFAE